MRTVKTIVGALGLLIAIFALCTVVWSVTAIYQTTLQLVDNAGNIMTGTASGSTASYNLTARIVDGSGNILNSLVGTPSGAAGGDLSGSYPNPGVAKVNGNTPGGTCTNQVVTSVNSSAVPTCSSLAQAMAATGFYRLFWTGTMAATPSTSATNFWNPNGGSGAVAITSIGDVTQYSPGASTTVVSMTCGAYSAAGALTTPGATASYAVTLDTAAGTTTAATCTINNSTNPCSFSGSVAISANTVLSLQDVPTNTPTALLLKCVIEMDL